MFVPDCERTLIKREGAELNDRTKYEIKHIYST